MNLRRPDAIPPPVREPGKIWVGSVVVECKEIGRMHTFWTAVLGYEARDPPTDDWVV